MAGQAGGSVKGIIAGVVIIAAVVFMVWYYHGDNPAKKRDRDVLTIDIEDGTVHYVTKKIEDNYPLTNPDTDTPTLWTAYKCDKCKIIFPVEKGRMITQCIKCGNPNVGGATKEHEDYEVFMPK